MHGGWIIDHGILASGDEDHLALDGGGRVRMRAGVEGQEVLALTPKRLSTSMMGCVSGECRGEQKRWDIEIDTGVARQAGRWQSMRRGAVGAATSVGRLMTLSLRRPSRGTTHCPPPSGAAPWPAELPWAVGSNAPGLWGAAAGGGRGLGPESGSRTHLRGTNGAIRILYSMLRTTTGLG